MGYSYPCLFLPKGKAESKPLVFVFEQGFYVCCPDCPGTCYAGLELTKNTCLCLLGIGGEGMHHHAWPKSWASLVKWQLTWHVCTIMVWSWVQFEMNPAFRSFFWWEVVKEKRYFRQSRSDPSQESVGPLSQNYAASSLTWNKKYIPPWESLCYCCRLSP